VGMATNIPPHNLSEIVTACVALLDSADITVDELIEHVPAPDFPTAGIIYGTEGVREGYRTGPAASSSGHVRTSRTWRRAIAKRSSSTRSHIR